LHKQSVSGDAPTSAASNSTPVGEKAKLQAWKSKRGIPQEQAMLAYIAEADRQIRVYGSTAANPQTPHSTLNGNTAERPSAPATPTTPRGLAALPLLCAASAESRSAYVRRLQQTSAPMGWWQRQEALTARPGTLGSLPEAILLSLASLVEFLSLNFQSSLSAWQSFWWPTHNVLLCLWMQLILLSSIAGSSWQLLCTVLWGSQRTGISLSIVWEEEIRPSTQAIHTLCEPHHPSIAVRLVGLFVLPYTFLVEMFCDGIVSGLTGGSLLAESIVHIFIVVVSWWYWFLVVPWLAGCMLFAAFWSGFCFALIDLAGV